MLAAYLVLMPLRWLALATGLLHHVWHPALFQIAAYLGILSAIVLGVDAIGLSNLVLGP